MPEREVSSQTPPQSGAQGTESLAGARGVLADPSSPLPPQAAKRAIRGNQKALAFRREGDTLGTDNYDRKGISKGSVEDKYISVTLRQREVLTLLSQRRLSIGELASLLGVSYVASIKIVNRLEQKHLVKRVGDEWDRRRVFVNLTSAGWSMLNEESG